MHAWLNILLILTAFQCGTVQHHPFPYFDQLLLEYWCLTIRFYPVPFQESKETVWPSQQDLWQLLRETKLCSTVHLRPQIQVHTFSGTNRKQLAPLSSYWWGLGMDLGTMNLSSRRDLMLLWLWSPSWFLWGSRVCSCLTLLPTTVLWGPQWLHVILFLYKNLLCCTIHDKITEYKNIIYCI